jgi:hypothetical protein
MRLIERRAMPPFGHFNLIRFGKRDKADRITEPLSARAAG